jgi:hypothetical protein
MFPDRLLSADSDYCEDRTTASSLAEISSARHAPRRLPVRRQTLASIRTADTSRQSMPLIAPRMKVGLSSFRDKRCQCRFNVGTVREAKTKYGASGILFDQ